MARKEAIYKVDVEGAGAVRTIRQLNQELTETSQELGAVPGSITKMEDALYDLALQGQQNTQTFKDLQKRVAEYKQIIIETDRSIDALAEQGRGLSTALSLAEGTVAGFQAFTGVTAILGNENEELLETITKLQAAQGVLNSIEIIKQQLQNNAIKLTQAQTFAQKLYNKAVGKGTKATKLLRGALLATGIGAVIAGLVLLVQNWDKVTKALGLNTKAQQLNNQVGLKAVEGISKELSAADKLTKALNDNTLSEDEKREAVKDLQAQYPKLLSNIDAEKDGLDEINKALELNTMLLREKAKAEAIAELRAEQYKKQIEAQINAQTEQNESILTRTLSVFGDETTTRKVRNAEAQETINKTNEEIKALDELDKSIQKNINNLKKQGAADGDEKKDKKPGSSNWLDKRKKAQEEAERIAREQFELEEEIRRMRLSAEELEEIAIADKYDALMEKAHGNAELEKQLVQRQEEELQELFKKRLEEQQAIQDEAARIAEEKKNEELDRLAEAQEMASTTERERDVMAVTDKYFELIELAKQHGQDTAALEAAQEEELNALREQYRQEDLAKEQEKTDKKIQMFNEYAQTVQDGLGALSSLNDLVADIAIQRAEGDQVKQEKIQRKAFNINKALQLSIATVQGVQAVQNAYTTALASPITAVNPAYPFIQAGIAGATSAINIAKIASAKFQGGGGAPSVSAPSGGTGGGASSFSISTGDDTSSSQTFLNQDGTQQQQTTQVVVVETDISLTQANIATIDEQSTL